MGSQSLCLSSYQLYTYNLYWEYPYYRQGHLVADYDLKKGTGKYTLKKITDELYYIYFSDSIDGTYEFYYFVSPSNLYIAYTSEFKNNIADY